MVDGEHTEGQRERSALLTLVALLGVITLMWILGAARSAGPDEPGHNIRSGALIRWQLDGEAFTEFDSQTGFELPTHIGFPDPVCYAFNPHEAASCATGYDPLAGDQLLGTRSADYPIWGHLLPGVGTLGPGATSAWASRIFDALIPVALLAVSLCVASRRKAVGVGATLLAVTPMAWFMFAVVNPSGLVIAGGIGLWTALTASSRTADSDHLVRWLFAASWAALVLPRRDGLVWAALILSLAVLINGEDLGRLWRRLGRGPQLMAGAATLATLAWASRSDTNAALALFVAPLVPIGATVARAQWRRLETATPRTRNAVLAAATAVGGVGLLMVMSLRREGFDRGVLRLIIGETGTNLNQAIGVLGWLDTPIPTTSLYLWIAGLGLLIGAAVVANHRTMLLGAAAIVGTALLSSWVLTMLQNNNTGTYWQGRYYLPLLAGVPILFSRIKLDADASRRLGLAAAGVSLVVSNIALASMMRRFGVGISGSLLPWEWDTYGAPIPPVVVLIVHGAASIALIRWTIALAPASRVRR